MPKNRTPVVENNSEVEPSLAPASLEILARFNPADNSFLTASGYTLKFRAISAGILDRAQQRFEDMFDKPEVPIIIIDHGKERTSEKLNHTDPDYLVEVEKWNTKVLRELNVWLYAVGILVDIPEQPEKGSLYEEILLLEGEDCSEHVKKYLYISSLLTTSEFTFMNEAIIGNASVTKEGLQQAAEDFPS